MATKRPSRRLKDFMVLGCALVGLLAPLSLQEAKAQATEVLLPENLAAELEAKNVEFFGLRREFYYCAIAEEKWIKDENGVRRRVLQIHSLIQPDQETGIDLNWKDNKIRYWNTHDRCPSHANADVHNHPIEGQFVFSGTDLASWRLHRMKYHIILFPARDPEDPENYVTRVAAWWIDGDNMRLIRKMRIQ